MSRVNAAVTLVLILLLAAGCAEKTGPEVAAGVDECGQCRMVIDQVNQSCGYLVEDEFVAFDSPGCLLRSYDNLRRKGEELPVEIFFADYRDASFHPVADTTFLLTGHVPTVMGANAICFGSKDAAEEMHAHDDETITDWVGYRTLRSQPDVILEVAVTSDGMTPEAIEVARGDIVELRVCTAGLTTDLTVAIEGYPEAGEVALPASGDEVVIRLLAQRPGAGFPIVGVGLDEPLGMMKVTGAHTADEEAL